MEDCSGPSNQFVDEVRDLLSHLFDPVYSPPALLTQMLGRQAQSGDMGVRALVLSAIDRLKPGGTAAIQAITIDEADFDGYRSGPDFIQRYIFPGGMLLTKTVMREFGDKYGLVLENVETFRLSYAKTLRLWRERFLERWPMIAPLGYDEEFKRKWVYYLSYCEAGFTEGSIDVGIYQYRRPLAN